MQQKSGQVLIVGLNWIGDNIMSMPAIQAWRRLHPDLRLVLLLKPSVLPVWGFHTAPDQCVALELGLRGTQDVIAQLRERGPFDRAYVLPHSFRAAWIPWRAGIPERIGLPGHWRDALLTAVVEPRLREGREHQMYEYMDLLAPGADGAGRGPEMTVPEELQAAARNRLQDLRRPWIALIPGAARGPSKQWPRRHFIELGRRLTKDSSCGVLVLGAPAEQALCDSVAAGIGSTAVSLAGRTTLREWMALLAVCDLVMANDSGAMHVAAALGTPVIAFYGMTDPVKTGPLTEHATLLQDPAVTGCRDVPRKSDRAQAALAAITPERAYRAARDTLDQTKATPL